MKVYYKHLGLMMLMASIIYLAGCSKSTPAASAPLTVVGTWGETSLGEKIVVNGVTKYDTTVMEPLGAGAFTFSASGYYVEFYPGGQLGGAYTYSGNTLSIFDTASGANKWVPLTVTALTANTLSIQEEVDSIHNGGMDSVGYLTFNLTR